MASPVTVVYFLFVIVLVSSSSRDLDDEFEGSRTLQLEHSFNRDSGFVKRGTVVIHSLKESKAQFTAAGGFSGDEVRALKTSAKDNGLYKVRIPLRTNEDGTTVYVSSATTSCSVLESGLKDEITVNFDQSGEVLGMSIRADVPACSGLDLPEMNLTHWRTHVEVTTTVSGPSPDTQTYIEKLKRDEQAKLKNDDGDTRSFFSKYWMYIVPVVIMMVIMSSADQPAAGGAPAR